MTILKQIPRSLKLKILAISFLAVIAVLFVANAVLLVQQVITARYSMISELAVLSGTIASQSTAAIVFGDRRAGYEILGALRTAPHMLSAVVYLPSREVFAAYKRNDATLLPAPSAIDHPYVFTFGNLTYARPIYLESDLIGMLYLRSSLSPLYRNLTAYGLTMGLALALALFVAYLIVSKLVGKATAPIFALVNLMGTVSRDKDYSLRALADSRDEVGLLVDRFNDMITQIHERDMELALHRKHLEDLVLQRTAELEALSARLRRSFEGMVQAVGLVVETRDFYAAGHQRRVAELATAIAAKMGLDKETIEAIRIAGLLHDLGKIQVPAEILSRPGKLGPVERQLVEVHPQVGFDILQAIEFPWLAGEIVLQHHERVDGSGYPKGLKGLEIRVESGILAVADVVEAMTSHRPYRPAFPIDYALMELQANRGTLYPGPAVDACLTLFREDGFSLKIDVSGSEENLPEGW
jgi:putative nucleotidyltransferase with HDIG domain